MADRNRTYNIKGTFSGDLYVDSHDVIMDESFTAVLEAVDKIEEMIKSM